MADKYLYVGAAFNGDGTTPDVAASNGAAGAWNNLNVMYGTAPAYGTLVSGDTIYVRSKTAANADVWYSAGDYVVGPASGITGTTWIIDNGVTWSGVNGSVTFQAGPTNAYISLRTSNNYIALKPGGLVLSGRSNYTYPIIASGVTAKNVEFSHGQHSDVTTTGAVNVGGSILEDCIFTFAYFPCQINTSVANTKTVLINPTIRLTSTTGLSQSSGVFSSTAGSSLEVYGGTVSGVGAIASQALFSASAVGSAAPEYTVVGLYAPIEMPLVSSGAEGSPMFNLRMLGADKKASASIGASWGYADSRNDGYYPTLSATLPDTASTGWSWKLKANYAKAYRPAKLVMSKMYTGAAAVKTLTLELLISNSISASTDKSNVYMLVQYIDATTGNLVSQTTKATGALDTSTAGWSATTYGAASFDKRKLSITTSSSIKQDTLVTAVLFVAYAASLANDMYFVDPDPSLT